MVIYFNIKMSMNVLSILYLWIFLFSFGHFLISVQASSGISKRNDTSSTGYATNEFKVICYLPNYAFEKNPAGVYTPEHMDNGLCSHIIYGPAVLHYFGLIAESPSLDYDIDGRLVDFVSVFKNKGIKVLISVGGWDVSSYDLFYDSITSATHRRKLINGFLNFTIQNGFDGLDINWQRAIEQKNGNETHEITKNVFSNLMEEMSIEFHERGLLLTALVSANKSIIESTYNISSISEHLDWITVETPLDNFGSGWIEKSGFFEPVYKTDNNPFLKMISSINYFISEGIPSKKVFMDFPFFGASFIKSSYLSQNKKLLSSAGVDLENQPEFLAYNIICNKVNKRSGSLPLWQYYRDPKGLSGSCAFREADWIIYDDTRTISQKAQYAKDLDLGGILVQPLHFDDFLEQCNQGRYPLLKALHSVIQTTYNSEQSFIVNQPAKFGSNTTINETYSSKVLCVFTNWSADRRKVGQFVPENIDSKLCTHIIYEYTLLNDNSYTIVMNDYYNDIDNKFYQRVTGYKNKGLKILVAIGGHHDSYDHKYSTLVSSPELRYRFVTHTIQFLMRYGFDGLQFDWRYPVCWQSDCTRGKLSDKEGFTQLIKELSTAFKENGLLLSAGISSMKKVIDKAYDVPTLAKYLDLVAVHHYDFHHQWNNKTGHIAPLYEHPDVPDKTFNANFSMRYLIDKGFPREKLILGVPFYGQSFKLTKKCGKEMNNSTKQIQCGLNQDREPYGYRGKYLHAYSTWGYYEICEKTLDQKNPYTLVKDSEGRIGPYIYKGKHWISFDDAEQIKRKAEFIKELQLGGAMAWALDLDDFENHCDCEKYPLLKTLNRVLRNYPEDKLCNVTRIYDNVDYPEYDALLPPKKIICYYQSWFWYLKKPAQFVPENIEPEHCTHLIYMWATVDDTKLILRPDNPEIEIDKKLYQRTTSFKSKGLKVLTSIGGEYQSDERIHRLVNNNTARSHFVREALVFMNKYGFDGLDIAWMMEQNEFQSFPSEKMFTTFIKEISAEFKPRGLLLSAVVAWEKEKIDRFSNGSMLAEYLDWVSVPTFDMHKNSKNRTEHFAPLYRYPGEENKYVNVNFSLNHWINKGIPASKLVMGIGLFSRVYTLRNSSENGLGAPVIKDGNRGHYTRRLGLSAFYEICEKIKFTGWNVTKDKYNRVGSYASYRDQWAAYDDTSNVVAKAKLVRKLRLAGAFFYAINLGDFRGVCTCGTYPLLKAYNSELSRIPADPDCTTLNYF